jgi:mRNA interferase MazF
MVISRGEVWWVDFGDPIGSGPGYLRPAIIVSSDAFNRSAIGTAVVVPLTSNLRHANLVGGVLIQSKSAGLPKPSVANATQVITVDRTQLVEHAGGVSRSEAEAIDQALRAVLQL